MFYEKTFQTLIINEDIQRRFKRRNVKARQKPLPQAVVEEIKKYLVLFLETSSIHGLNHFVVVGRHPCEIFLWLTMVILSVCGTVYISGTTWTRYQSSPTVVSLDRDMFAWNTTFPCVTICPDEKIDPEKLDNYLRSTNDVDKEKFKVFIKALANATFENFDTVPIYDVLAPSKYLETILNLSSSFQPTFTTAASEFNMHPTPTITEMGLCYTINSKVAVYNSPEYREANRWDIIEHQNSTFFVHPLDGEVFAQVNLTASYNAYIHGPLEVPDISTKHHHSPENLHMALYVTAVTVYTETEAASLSVAQRRCRFQHENNLKHNSVYTYTMCRIECRIRLCLKYCQCIPYFYRRIGDERICDVKGLHCLVEHKAVLLDLKGGKELGCECFPICDDVNYIIQTFTLQKWVIGTTTFQWGIVTYPRMRYKRDIIFGFTDLLVAVGGMAGLFLGCSVLSFAEIVYFLTLRLICYTKSNIKK